MCVYQHELEAINLSLLLPFAALFITKKQKSRKNAKHAANGNCSPVSQYTV